MHGSVCRSNCNHSGFRSTRNELDIGCALFCDLDILDNNLSGYLVESMSVDAGNSDKCMRLMGSSKQFGHFSSRRASASSGGLQYNAWMLSRPVAMG